MENSRIEQIKTFLKESPEDAFLNYALAIEYLGINNTNEAKIIFENLIQNNPDYSATYYHFGKLIQNQGNRELAISIFENGIKIADKNKELHAAAELRSALNELLYDEE